MLSASKYKWIASVVLGGILIFLAMIGGEWKATYAADASVNQDPVINYISPVQVPAGSASKTMVIGGTNFGTSEDFIRVWIHDASHDYTAAPINVLIDGISVVITDTLMVSPTLYTIRVVISNGQSIPAVPPWIPFDQFSNPVDFLVYQPVYQYLPRIEKNSNLP